jgi:hypothetical protein
MYHATTLHFIFEIYPILVSTSCLLAIGIALKIKRRDFVHSLHIKAHDFDRFSETFEITGPKSAIQYEMGSKCCEMMDGELSSYSNTTNNK